MMVSFLLSRTVIVLSAICTLIMSASSVEDNDFGTAAWEEAFVREVTASRISEYHFELTSEPHIAGMCLELPRLINWFAVVVGHCVLQIFRATAPI
jgi:hypothetical protein